MSQPTAAQLFDPSNQQLTAVGVAALKAGNRVALIRQMRPDAPVTFQPALHVSAMWQAMSVQPTNGNDEQKPANLLHSV
jgi:hypothetical protein